MKKPLIGICGAAGSGKDTLAEGIAKIDVAVIYHFADPIKNALNAMFGWTPAHWKDRDWKEAPIPWLTERYGTMDVSPRTLAQTLGTEWGRDLVHPDLWLKIAQQKWNRVKGQAHMGKGGNVILGALIIPDVRFENEAEWIKDEGGILFEVNRPGVEPVAQHASERGIPDTLIDYSILNDRRPSDMVSNARELIWQYWAFSKD
jgi:hypothetical protein